MTYLIITNINVHYRHHQFNEISKLKNLDVLFTVRKLPKNRFDFEKYNTHYNAVSALQSLKRLMEYEKIIITENGRQTVFFVLLYGVLSLFTHAKAIIWIGNNSRGKSSLKKSIFYCIYYSLLSFLYDRAIFYTESSRDFYKNHNYGLRLKNYIISGQQYPFYEEYNILPTRKITIPSFNNRILKLLFIGQDIPRKGLFDILNSINVIHGTRKGGVHLTLVGGNFSNVRSKLKCPTTCLKFANPQDKKRLFEEHDFLISPSRHEPWGHTIVEALGFGTLPIISDKAGTYDILEKYYGLDRENYLWVKNLNNLPEIISNLDIMSEEKIVLNDDGLDLLFNVEKFASDLVLL